jgi:F-type H+-transporting ATPase subunit a
MVNMAVDHLLVTVASGIFVFILPIPVMVLSTLVIIVQVVVFCLLSSVYISLATEHEEHEPSHGAGTHGAAAHAAAH